MSLRTASSRSDSARTRRFAVVNFVRKVTRDAKTPL